MKKTEPKAQNPLEALETLRLQRDWTYRELAAFIGINLSTLFSAVRRGRANRRTTFKIERFIEAQRKVA